MAPGEETDSGMESQDSSVIEGAAGSLTTASEDKGAETSASGTSGTGQAIQEFNKSDDGFGDEPEETLGERLWGLTEMFPESVRDMTYAIVSTTTATVKGFYGFSRSAFWVVFSSSIILFAPVIFEVERVQMEDAQRTQQKQMLLGPNTAVASATMPPMQQR